MARHGGATHGVGEGFAGGTGFRVPFGQHVIVRRLKTCATGFPASNGVSPQKEKYVIRMGAFARGLMMAILVLVFGGVLPLAVTAAPPTGIDPRLVITRLGDQPPAGVSSAPGTATMLQSFHFVAQGTLTISGQPDTLSLAMNGDFAMPDRLHATVTLTDSVSTDTIPPIELVVVGSKPYVHLTGDASPTGKDIWVLIDNPDGTGGMFPGGMMPNLANLPPIPTQTQTIGDETINGTPTMHMRTTIDATALLGGMSKGAKPSKLTVDTWTGKADNLPRRVALNGNLSIDPNVLAAQFGQEMDATAKPVNAMLSFTVDFSNLNAPVTITAPTSFVKLSDLLNQ